MTEEKQKIFMDILPSADRHMVIISIRSNQAIVPGAIPQLLRQFSNQVEKNNEAMKEKIAADAAKKSLILPQGLA